MELWVIKVMNQIQTLTAESMCFRLWSVESLWEAFRNPSVSRFFSLRGKVSHLSQRWQRRDENDGEGGENMSLGDWDVAGFWALKRLNLSLSAAIERENLSTALSLFFPSLQRSLFVFLSVFLWYFPVSSSLSVIQPLWSFRGCLRIEKC